MLEEYQQQLYNAVLNILQLHADDLLKTGRNFSPTLAKITKILVIIMVPNN